VGPAGRLDDADIDAQLRQRQRHRLAQPLHRKLGGVVGVCRPSTLFTPASARRLLYQVVFQGDQSCCQVPAANSGSMAAHICNAMGAW